MFAKSHENNSVCLFEVFFRNYSLIDKRGIDLISEFLLTFKLWKDKKKFSTISTNEKKSEHEQPLEKKIQEDEKLIKQLQEKK